MVGVARGLLVGGRSVGMRVGVGGGVFVGSGVAELAFVTCEVSIVNVGTAVSLVISMDDGVGVWGTAVAISGSMVVGVQAIKPINITQSKPKFFMAKILAWNGVLVKWLGRR